jgi:hypothetical protein
MNKFDEAAWFLYTYTGTLSFSDWRKAVKQTFFDLEKEYGTAEANKLLRRMMAYYCMEVGTSYKGVQAISKFRNCHRWPDFKNSDAWWVDEWNTRRVFDKEVGRIRAELLKIPSIAPEDVQDDDLSREAVRVLHSEAEKRAKNDENRELNDALYRVMVSIYGARAILSLYNSGLLADRQKIPSVTSSYFLERSLVSTYGEKLLAMKAI